MAWNFVNDSLSTTVSLQWEPEIIAVALIYLASKLSKFNVVDWAGKQPEHCKWWDMFVQDVTMDILEDICHQVLDLYQQQNTKVGSESPPQLPPSKTSPPMKRAKFSPTHSKSSPNVTALPIKTIAHTEVDHGGSLHKLPPADNNNMHYAYPPAPPLPPQPHSYSSQSYPHASQSYAPPSSVPPNYNTTQPHPPQSHYRQPMPSNYYPPHPPPHGGRSHYYPTQ